MGINRKEEQGFRTNELQELLRRDRIVRGTITYEDIIVVTIDYVVNISQRSGQISVTAEGRRVNIDISPAHVCAEIENERFGNVTITGKICAEFENEHGKLVANAIVTYRGLEINIDDLIIITW
jgi:hypothetical protein